MKISIVIPSYLRHDKLKDCLLSITNYVTHEDTELVLVANGAAEETKTVFNEFASTWKGEAIMLWFDEPIGYPRACNAGIRESTGEFIVLLNDDAEFLSQQRNECIDVMLSPMLQDGAVGVTGPLQAFDENSGHEFLIFFCVMVRRACFDETGLLDEGFKYFGEDTSFCIEAEKKGWKVIRVPEEHPTELVPLDPTTTTLEAWKHDKVHTGNFRIWHDAESTIGRLSDCDEVLRESRARLKELYGSPDDINIHRAMYTDGWIAHDELIWLARQAKACGPNALIIQIGAWHGKSSRAISDNMCEGARLIDVDSYNGSSGEPDQHATAKEREGDHCFQWYWDNQFEHIMQGKVIPLRMLSHNAAHTLNHRGVKADMIFIDGDHSAEGIKTDVEAWLPLLKDGGLLCGHDYYKENEGPWWVHVRQFIETRFPNVEKSATSVWHVRPHERGKVYDCFIYSNEQDVLEIRLNTLNDTVDFFVLVEGTQYHNGEPKTLHFEEHKERFAPFLHKIIHVVVDDWPEANGSIYDNAWMRERWQRDAILRGLTECSPNDIIILGDADEIANHEAVANYNVSQGLCRLKQRMFYYYLNCENKEGWDWQKIAPYSLVKQLTPCGVRYPPAGDTPLIESGGWHFSFLGNSESVLRKIQTYSHQEFCVPEIANLEHIEQAMADGMDVFGRDLKYEFVDIDEEYPECVKLRQMELEAMGLIKRKTVEIVWPPLMLPTDISAAEEMDAVERWVDSAKKQYTVTAEVSTKDRYTTTLPICLTSIITQTHKPDKLVIYDDGDLTPEQLVEMSPFKGLFQMCDERGIKWEVFNTPKMGQVANHQHALDTADTDIVLRCDDDVILEPNVLEELLKVFASDENVGAVAPLIHHPSNVQQLPPTVNGTVDDLLRGVNIQWYSFNGTPRDVEHLYSSFAYKTNAGRQAGGYPRDLSRIGHREESWFSMKIRMAGFRLMVTPFARAWHLQQPTGGIRSFDNKEFWEQDNQKFMEWLSATTGARQETRKFVCLDCGIGDHMIFKSLLPKFIEKHGPPLIAACYPDVFAGENVELISIADAKIRFGDIEQFNVYKFAWERNMNGPIAETFKIFYEL